MPRHAGSRHRRSGALESLRTRAGARRTIKTISFVMILAGLALVLYPLATNAWGRHLQSGLRTEFASSGLRRQYVAHSVPVGHALTRIEIPRIGVDTIVVQGTTLSALRAGSGHYVRSALPCEDGNAAIAGHRTTYSEPFAHLDQLRPGDVIRIETPIGRCTYRVERRPWSVGPYDWSAVLPRGLGGSHLTLTTCNPPGWATERLVVRARLVRSSLAGQL